MNRALLSVLVIILVTGSFLEQSDAIFRAAKNQIKKLQREVPVRRREGPFCYSAEGIERMRRYTGNPETEKSTTKFNHEEEDKSVDCLLC